MSNISWEWTNILFHHFFSFMMNTLQKLYLSQRLWWRSARWKTNLLVFMTQRLMYIFCIRVHSLLATNRNIFSLLEWMKSAHKMLLILIITICVELLLTERNNSCGNIIWSLSFICSLAVLSCQPGHIAVKERSMHFWSQRPNT